MSATAAPQVAPRQLALPLANLSSAACVTCEEAEHLLGADSLASVAKRLGYRSAPNLTAHLNRHGRGALADRYRLLTTD